MRIFDIIFLNIIWIWIIFDSRYYSMFLGILWKPVYICIVYMVDIEIKNCLTNINQWRQTYIKVCRFHEWIINTVVNNDKTLINYQHIVTYMENCIVKWNVLI